MGRLMDDHRVIGQCYLEADPLLLKKPDTNEISWSEGGQGMQ